MTAIWFGFLAGFGGFTLGIEYALCPWVDKASGVMAGHHFICFGDLSEIFRFSTIGWDNIFFAALSTPLPAFLKFFIEKGGRLDFGRKALGNSPGTSKIVKPDDSAPGAYFS